MPQRLTHTKKSLPLTRYGMVEFNWQNTIGRTRIRHISRLNRFAGFESESFDIRMIQPHVLIAYTSCKSANSPGAIRANCQALICECGRWSAFDDHSLFSICLTLSLFVLLAYFRSPKSVLFYIESTELRSFTVETENFRSALWAPRGESLPLEPKVPPDDIFIQA